MADGGGLENRYGVTPIVGSNPTPSARQVVSVAPVPADDTHVASPRCPDTPRREVADGMTDGRISVFPQVGVPHVDKVPLAEAGHRPLDTPNATIR